MPLIADLSSKIERSRDQARGAVCPVEPTASPIAPTRRLDLFSGSPISRVGGPSRAGRPCVHAFGRELGRPKPASPALWIRLVQNRWQFSNPNPRPPGSRPSVTRCSAWPAIDCRLRQGWRRRFRGPQASPHRVEQVTAADHSSFKQLTPEKRGVGGLIHVRGSRKCTRHAISPNSRESIAIARHS
jgi:hypothetical protein